MKNLIIIIAVMLSACSGSQKKAESKDSIPYQGKFNSGNNNLSVNESETSFEEAIDFGFDFFNKETSGSMFNSADIESADENYKTYSRSNCRR